MKIESKQFPWCAVVIKASLGHPPVENFIILTINTGASHIQTYATPQEVKSLADDLLTIAVLFEQKNAILNRPDSC